MLATRIARDVSSVVLALHGALLILFVPVTGFMVLESAWEGGDEALKRRIAEWGIVSAPIGFLTGVLLIWTATSVARRSGGIGLLLAFDTALLVVLATGWAWVFQGDLLSDLSMLAVWTALSLPGIAAALFTLLSRTPAPSGEQAL